MHVSLESILKKRDHLAGRVVNSYDMAQYREFRDQQWLNHAFAFEGIPVSIDDIANVQQLLAASSLHSPTGIQILIRNALAGINFLEFEASSGKPLNWTLIGAFEAILFKDICNPEDNIRKRDKVDGFFSGMEHPPASTLPNVFQEEFMRDIHEDAIRNSLHLFKELGRISASESFSVLSAMLISAYPLLLEGLPPVPIKESNRKAARDFILGHQSSEILEIMMLTEIDRTLDYQSSISLQQG